MNIEMQTKIREWEAERDKKPAHTLSSCSCQIPKMD